MSGEERGETWGVVPRVLRNGTTRDGIVVRDLAAGSPISVQTRVVVVVGGIGRVVR